MLAITIGHCTLSLSSLFSLLTFQLHALRPLGVAAVRAEGNARTTPTRTTRAPAYTGHTPPIIYLPESSFNHFSKSNSIGLIHREGLYLPSVPTSEQNKIYFNSDGTNTVLIWLTPFPYFWHPLLLTNPSIDWLGFNSADLMIAGTCVKINCDMCKSSLCICKGEHSWETRENIPLCNLAVPVYI